MSLSQVPSSLVARHASWVRQQASSLMRRLPSNVEKADLIQVGLIAVAHAAVTFRWHEPDPDGTAEQAFIGYAKKRVRGAMLDELRQMDPLTRPQRRKVKALLIARERWQGRFGQPPSLSDLASFCAMSIGEIAQLDAMAASVADIGWRSLDDGDARAPSLAVTEADEVEARVDTEIVLRRLARIWPDLPERDRRVIDAYLGIGLAPVQLAREMNVTISRMSQWHRQAVDHIADRVGTRPARTTDSHKPQNPDAMNRLVTEREAALASAPGLTAWSEMVQRALSAPGRQTNRNDTVPSGP